MLKKGIAVLTIGCLLATSGIAFAKDSIVVNEEVKQQEKATTKEKPTATKAEEKAKETDKSIDKATAAKTKEETKEDQAPSREEKNASRTLEEKIKEKQATQPTSTINEEEGSAKDAKKEEKASDIKLEKPIKVEKDLSPAPKKETKQEKVAEQKQAVSKDMKEKWERLTDEQQAEIYDLKDQCKELNKKVIDKYIEYEVIDAKAGKEIKDKMDERGKEMRDKGDMPGFGHKGHGKCKID